MSISAADDPDAGWRRGRAGRSGLGDRAEHRIPGAADGTRTPPRLEQLRGDPAGTRSKERIPYVTRPGGELFYNFWQDSTNPRCVVWRRTTVAKYRKAASRAWEVLLDVDAPPSRRARRKMGLGGRARAPPEYRFGLVKLVPRRVGRGGECASSNPAQRQLVVTDGFHHAEPRAGW